MRLIRIVQHDMIPPTNAEKAKIEAGKRRIFVVDTSRVAPADRMWDGGEDMLAGRERSPGRTADDIRPILEPVLWRVRTGRGGPISRRNSATGTASSFASIAGPREGFSTAFSTSFRVRSTLS